MMENNNKESFNLLDMSGSCSESGSEFRGYVHPPKKKKVKRRVRGSQGRNNSDDDAHPAGDKHICIVCEIGRTVSIWLAIALLILWLLMLMWLGLRLHSQLSRLNSEVEQVVAGSKGVPDALQKCHSMSKELQHNQTLLLKQLMSLTSQVTNFSLQVKEVHHGLSEVEDRLKGSPELVRVPQELAELSDSVGHLGSSVGGLEASVTSLKSNSQVLQNESNTLKQEVTQLKAAVLQLSNATSQGGGGISDDKMTNSKKEEELEKLVVLIKKELADLTANVSRLNNTIVKKLNMNDKELSEQQKIFDMLSNVSTKVITLEGSCASLKEQKELSAELQQISTQTNETLKRVFDAEVQLGMISKKLNSEESTTASPVPGTTFNKEHLANPELVGISSKPTFIESPSTASTPQNLDLGSGSANAAVNSDGQLEEGIRNNTNA